MGAVAQAKTPRQLPVVLTTGEVRRLLGEMDGTVALVAQLLYGTNMRLMECLRLRVNDVEFERLESSLRQGKGGKDRMTMPPASARSP